MPMTSNFLATLLHPFANGTLEPPAAGDVLFLNAEVGLDRNLFSRVKAVQGFRPGYLALEREGTTVMPQPEGHDYGAALILCDRHRRRNEANIAEALARVRAGGLVVAAGGKTDGIASLRKRMADLLPLDSHASKYHGNVFWLTRPLDAAFAIAELEPRGMSVDGRFHTGVGVFSADAVDPASRLLADNLPPGLAGKGADFAAGWGYLSLHASGREGVVSMDLYEAEYAALEAARFNLEEESGRCRFFWHDLLSEPVESRYDFIVMNPPFHAGRAADPTMGQRMIQAAAKALKPQGRLFLVANRGLPYEATVAKAFRQSGELVRDQRFKVLWGRR